MSRLHTTNKHWGEVSESNWEKTLAYVRNELPKRKRRWIFRGLSDYGHGLISTLDRAFIAAGKANIKISREERWKHEANMLYQFKRRAHHYLGAGQTPSPKEFLEWFSLMRHYGAPSRLLDFSNSFYVAAHFAVCSATERDAAVFCVNHPWLEKLVTERLVGDDKFFQDPAVFWEYAMPYPCGSKREPFVVPVTPFRSNERSHVQQGLFLCPTDVSTTFIKNLESMCPDSMEAAKNILKIRIKRAWHKEVISDLRAKNISSESLYPGLAGFAGSIEDLLYLNLPLVDGRLNESIKQSPQF